MNKQTRYELYKGAVLPGWWPILDKYVPQILAIDPECELYIKEKCGFLRIGFHSEKIGLQKRIEIGNAAELASSKVCEFCGAPGRHRPNRMRMQTLCDRCNHLNGKTMQTVILNAEQRWLESTEAD